VVVGVQGREGGGGTRDLGRARSCRDSALVCITSLTGSAASASVARALSKATLCGGVRAQYSAPARCNAASCGLHQMALSSINSKGTAKLEEQARLGKF